MDLLRIKLSSSILQPKPRLPVLDKSGESIKPEIIGLLPNETHYDLCCPNIKQSENVDLILANKTKDHALLVNLKWRPNESSGCVTLSVNLKLIFGSTTYLYNNVETYRPDWSSKRPGRIVQYGSNESNFRFIIESAFRRSRVIFRGRMSVLGKEGETKFVKLNLIGAPTSQTFDFKTSLDQTCFTEQWRAKRPNITIKEAAESLVLPDRLDQICRFVGDCSIDDQGSDGKMVMFLFGFYAKNIPIEPSSDVKTKSLRAYLVNGQAFHIILNQKGDNEMESGFTCYTSRPPVGPIQHPSTIDWASIDENVNEFKSTVHGQNLVFEFDFKRDQTKQDLIFSVDMKGTEGWAILKFNDLIDSKEEQELMTESFEEWKKNCEDGLYLKDCPIHIGGDDASSNPIISISEPICTRSDIVGSKASSLAYLMKFSKERETFSVSNALVLSRFAYDMIMNENEIIKTATEELAKYIGDNDEIESLKERCENIINLFKEAKFPEELKAKLVEKLNQVFDNKFEQLSFAVRSSSWGEDDEDISAAGQLTTELNVKGLDSIIKSILICFGSKYSYQSVEYKRQHGLSPNIPMAVIVQSMVSCEKAGVMFTCDPINGDNSTILITANYGLGETVVSGQADPDTILVKVNQSKPDELKIESKNIGKKLTIIDGQESVDRSKCCLEDNEILELAKYGQLVGKIFRSYRDIEWGFKDGKVFMFQSRPITSLDNYTETEIIHESDRPSRAEDEWTTRVNFNEVFPYAVTPFTMTFYVFSWNFFGVRMSNKVTQPVEYVPECSFEVLYDSYYPFFGLRRSFLLPFIEGVKKSPLMISTEIGFFGHEVGDQPGLMAACRHLPWPEMQFQGFKFDMNTATFRMSPLKIVCREYDILKTVRDSIEANKLVPEKSENMMMGLYKQLIEIFRYLGTSFENHYLTIIISGHNNHAIHSLLANYIQDPKRLYSALNKFLSAAQNVISAEIPRRINEMANLIRAKGPDELKSFVEKSESEALEYIEKSDDLAEKFNIFIERFGHRCYNEFELFNKPWRQDRGKIVEMIQKSCSVEKPITERDKIIDTDKIIDSLDIKLSMKDRLLMKHILVPRSQTYVTAREYTKDILIAYVDILRIASRKLAKEMKRNLRIPDEDLFYYLLLEEIEPLIRCPQPGIVNQATRRRQVFNRYFTEAWLFEEIISGYEMIPLQKRPTKEIDESLRNAPKLSGSPGSSGRVEANVCIIKGYDELNKVKPGDILVTYSTDIGFSPVFPVIAGIVTEVGGLISHGAVVAREYGLPSLLGVVDATRILDNGERVILDADNGQLIRLEK